MAALAEITLIEALAELKLIKSRVEKKKQFISNFIARQDAVKDPLAKQGGSVDSIKAERQSISDLLDRFVRIRTKIAEANGNSSVTILDQTRTISEWLVWKRDIAPVIKNIQDTLASNINSIRNDGRKKGMNVVSDGQATQPSDIVVNVDEKELAEWSEKTTEILGVLDGKLSLHNATVKVNV